MNVLIRNSRGALKPNFQGHFHDLVQEYDPAIFVVMETKIGGDRAKIITDKLPMDGAIHTETIGYSGGLWLLWNSNKVEVEAMAKTEQEIHVEVRVRSSNLSWIFSAIYASPKSEERCILWENLAKVAELHSLSWVLAGDFNEPLIEEDKFGGKGVNVNRSLAFKDCLDRCNMVDMGFSGPRFTWTNKRDLNNLILERIDRFFMNPSWCVLYLDAKVTHLPRCHSDHYPVLMEALLARSVKLNRPFRFQEFWLSDISFPSIVSKAWNRNRKLAEAVDNFSKEATSWNRNHFDNIHQKKRRIMARIYGVQKALSNNPNSYLINLEKLLQQELESILDQKRDLWILKSKLNWMIQGDRNTSYHMSTLARWKRNHIASVKDDREMWITEEREVIEYFRRGFTDYYTTSQEVAYWKPPMFDQWHVQLSNEANQALEDVVSTEEIKEALWSMKPFKALGPNGLHAGFFQRFWLIVGDLVKKEVNRVFVERKILEYLNSTHTVLIPKIQGPETIGNYKPISLCNSVYKIISKIIVARIKPHLEN